MQLKVLNNVACDEKKNDKDILNRNLVNSFENILDQVSINSPFVSNWRYVHVGRM